MANYIDKNILLEAYLHLEPDDEAWARLDDIKAELKQYLTLRSRFFLSTDVEVEIEFRDGSLKKYLTVLGCVYVFLHQYSDFREGVKLFAADATRLAESAINESLFVTKCRDDKVIHCEARPGILGALNKLVDDLEQIEYAARAGDLTEANKRIKKAKEDLTRLVDCLNDPRDPDYLSTELSRLATKIPNLPKPDPKNPYDMPTLAVYKNELYELRRHIKMSMIEKRKAIEERRRQRAKRLENGPE